MTALTFHQPSVTGVTIQASFSLSSNRVVVSCRHLVDWRSLASLGSQVEESRKQSRIPDPVREEETVTSHTHWRNHLPVSVSVAGM